MTHQQHLNAKLTADRDLAILHSRQDQADIKRDEENRQCLIAFLAFVIGCCTVVVFNHFVPFL